MFFCEVCKFLRTPFLAEHFRRLLLYHSKLNLYYLRTLLTNPIDCNSIPCLFQLNFVFFLLACILTILIPSFSFFTLSKRIQNLFTTTRKILDVFFILLFLSYLWLFTVPYLHLIDYTYLRLLIYTYVLFILLYELDKIFIIWAM